MKILKNNRGFGVEDVPFMLIATTLILLIVSAIGIHTLMAFLEGNKLQTTADHAIEIFKYSKLLSLGEGGSIKYINVNIPEGYAITMDGTIKALKNATVNENKVLEGALIIGKELKLKNIPIYGPVLGPGSYRLKLVYNTTNKPYINVSKE